MSPLSTFREFKNVVPLRSKTFFGDQLVILDVDMFQFDQLPKGNCKHEKLAFATKTFSSP
jgi:hypothetical protein